MNASIKLLNHRIYLLEFMILFFCYLMVEICFSWFFIPNAHLTIVGVKALSLAIFAFVLYDINSLKISEKIYVGIFTLLMIKLVFQSLIEYRSIFVHFEIYTVIFPVIYAVFVKSTLRKFNADLMGFIAAFYLLTYLAFMALFGHQFSLSLEHIEPNDGPFSGDTRIIHAHSIFMMIIPFLWYLNQFISTKKLTHFLLFLLCFAIILVHQHRSVWSSTIVAMIIYFVLIIRNHRKSINGVALFVTLSSFLLLLVVNYIATFFPEVLKFFSARFNEILDPTKDGSTGGFRIEQANMYYNFIVQKPFFGWNFEGYELENPLVDWWEQGTGHHFHEGFIEILFYHGIFGLIFKYSMLIYILVKAFSKNLSKESIVLIAYCLSGLVFSLNYVLPLVYWGHVGMCLYYLEKKPVLYYRMMKEEDEKIPEQQLISIN